MLRTKEHPYGSLHLIDETDFIHNSRSYIDLSTKKHINNGKKIGQNEINKYVVTLTDIEIIDFWDRNLKENYK